MRRLAGLGELGPVISRCRKEFVQEQVGGHGPSASLSLQGLHRSEFTRAGLGHHADGAVASAGTERLARPLAIGAAGAALSSRLHDSPHLGTQQSARILQRWVDDLGLDRANYGTHSMPRTKATLTAAARTFAPCNFSLGTPSWNRR